jgi:tetratricopeptide (TPR) repeat protein
VPPARSSPPTGSSPAARTSSPLPSPLVDPAIAYSADRSGPRPAIPSDPPPPRKPPSAPPGLSAELAERWADIVDRAARIDRNDYFAILDIARDASAAEVQTAFLALAKRWHPDRLPPELAPIRDVCSRVFARMNEAHATLADEERRKRYMRLLADGSGSPEMQEQVAKIVEAASRFQKAEVCFKRQDYEQAELLCRKALKADPTQPDYHAMRAWLLSLKPENQAPEKVVECIQALDAAVAISDRCERAFFWRGMLHKRLGKVALAQRDFKRTIELNPRNIDAAREVRLHQMRGGAHADERRPIPSPLPGKPTKADESGKQGLLGRLFKK